MACKDCLHCSLLDLMREQSLSLETPLCSYCLDCTILLATAFSPRQRLPHASLVLQTQGNAITNRDYAEHDTLVLQELIIQTAQSCCTLILYLHAYTSTLHAVLHSLHV